MSAVQVGAHDGVLVVHANAVHSRWIGYWVECECGWIGPGFPNQALAEQAHKRHVARVVQS